MIYGIHQRQKHWDNERRLTFYVSEYYTKQFYINCKWLLNVEVEKV